MGKLKIKNKNEGSQNEGVPRTNSSVRVPKKKVVSGTLHIDATFNNTKAIITDDKGNAIVSSSAGALGFSGARKSTPYAAAKVGEFLGEKSIMIGLKEATVIIRGVGAGRESVLRAFSGKGIQIKSIKDVTPVPHNGPRPPKPRRV